ncbi:hypothetical protein ACIO93_08440 [Streptomyces sp. NPDC087903]
MPDLPAEREAKALSDMTVPYRATVTTELFTRWTRTTAARPFD